MSKPLTTAKKASLGLGVSTAIFCGAEASLRSSGLDAAYDIAVVEGWQLQPNQRNRTIEGPRSGPSFQLSTNADGLRTRLTRVKRPKTRLVALTGDSVVFGWGVNDHQALPARTEAELAGLGPIHGKATEVLNGAHPGYSTTQTARLVQSKVAAYQPDVVVHFPSGHDSMLTLLSDREHFEGAQGPLSAVRVLLARHSRVYAWMRRKLYSDWREPMVMPGDKTETLRVPRVSEREREQALDEIRAAIAPNGQLMLAFLPGLQGHAEASGPPEQASLTAYMDRHGLAVLDLVQSCPGQRLALEHDSGHMSPRGTECVAAALAAALHKELLSQAP